MTSAAHSGIMAMLPRIRQLSVFVVSKSLPASTRFCSSRPILPVTPRVSTSRRLMSAQSVTRAPNMKDRSTYKKSLMDYLFFWGLHVGKDYKRQLIFDSAKEIFQHIHENVKYSELLKYGMLDDNFYNWVKITLLHVHLIDVRTTREGRDAWMLQRRLVTSMYKDINYRIKRLRSEGVIKMSTNKLMKTLIMECRTSVICYENGLVDDIKLAEAVWNCLYNGIHAERVNPMLCENWVNYIRYNLKQLEEMDMDTIIRTPEAIKWDLPTDLILIKT